MGSHRARAMVDLPRDPLDRPAVTEWAVGIWMELVDQWESDVRTALQQKFGEWVRTQVGPEELCGRLTTAAEAVALRPIRGQAHLYALQRRRRAVGRPGGVWDGITPEEIYGEFDEDQRLVKRFLEEEYERRLESRGTKVA